RFLRDDQGSNAQETGSPFTRQSRSAGRGLVDVNLFSLPRSPKSGPLTFSLITFSLSFQAPPSGGLTPAFGSFIQSQSASGTGPNVPLPLNHHAAYAWRKYKPLLAGFVVSASASLLCASIFNLNCISAEIDFARSLEVSLLLGSYVLGKRNAGVSLD